MLHVQNIRKLNCLITFTFIIQVYLIYIYLFVNFLIFLWAVVLPNLIALASHILWNLQIMFQTNFNIIKIASLL